MYVAYLFLMEIMEFAHLAEVRFNASHPESSMKPNRNK
jgi:hypothetical protein